MCLITPCWLYMIYDDTQPFENLEIRTNLKIYLAPMASDKRDGTVLKIESDFTGSSSIAPVCIPDKLHIPQNCSWKNKAATHHSNSMQVCEQKSNRSKHCYLMK